MGASVAFALPPPFGCLPAHSCSYQPSLFAAFPPALHTFIFTVLSHTVTFGSILSRTWALRQHSLFSRLFGSPSLPVHSCLCQPTLFAAFQPALHTCLFRSILAYGRFRQHSHMGASAAFALLPPFLAVFLHTVACVRLRITMVSNFTPWS